MALDLRKALVVGIYATALFDMSESDQMFKAALGDGPERVIDHYRRFMQEHEDEPLEPGTGYHLVKALLDLNRHITAFNPHIFFDDQDVHLEAAANLVPSGKVPYLTRFDPVDLIPAQAE